MSVDKVVLLPVWAEVPHLFSDQYRAALAWAEEVTLVSEAPRIGRSLCGGGGSVRAEGPGRSHDHDCSHERFQSARGATFRLPVKAQA
jgi:hypothetical protein